MFGKTSKLASMFSELAEAQAKIDASARRIVESVERMIDVSSREEPTTRDVLGGRDLRWYDEVGHALASNGFGPPVPYEPEGMQSKPAEARTICEYAIGDGGSVIASWFAIPGTDTRAERRVVNLATIFTDGTFVDTTSGGSESGVPVPPTELDEVLPEGSPLPEMVARHRRRLAAQTSQPYRYQTIAEFLAARQERSERRATYRRGLGMGLLEQFFAARFTGEKAELGQEYLQAVRRHPEWYKYANGAPAVKADPSLTEAAKLWPFAKLTFMMSASDDGRLTVTTFGMLFTGLPELLVSGVAANHSRAARFVAGTVTRAIARRRNEVSSDAEFTAALVSPAGVTLTLTPADVGSDPMFSPLASEPPVGRAEVRVALSGFLPGAGEPTLLGIEPLPGMTGSFDDRLRELCARLGCAVPAGAPRESFDAALEAASAQARIALPAMKARVRGGLSAGERVMVKMHAGEPGKGEYVWLDVREWRERDLDGVIATPAPRLKVAAGKPVTIADEQVFDLLFVGTTGFGASPATDVVAMDYGRDL